MTTDDETDGWKGQPDKQTDTTFALIYRILTFLAWLMFWIFFMMRDNCDCSIFIAEVTVANCGSTTFLILTFLAWLMLWIFFVEDCLEFLGDVLDQQHPLLVHQKVEEAQSVKIIQRPVLP
jgi:hypothetical protein